MRIASLCIGLGLFLHPTSICLPTASAGEASWPGFLGAGRSDSEPVGSQIPMTWSSKENLAWACPLPGYGQSSPVIWNGKAFVTCIDGPKKEILRILCISIDSGKPVWTYEQTTGNEGENSDTMSRAAPTPAVDASGVYAFFEGGDFIALNHEGEVRWKRDLVADYGDLKTNHGLSASVAQNDKLVFVWVQRKEDSYLLALKKDSGDVAWKVATPSGTAWSSPALVPMSDGSSQLVLSISAASAQRAPAGEGQERGGPKPPSGYLCGFDPESGASLWTLDSLAGNSSQTPVAIGPGQILVAASAGREGGPAKEATATNGLVEIQKGENGWEARYRWHAKRATSGFCSPCFHQGLVYFTDRQGIVYCLDGQTGEEVYSKRLSMSVWATPIGIGDHVYFFGEGGTTRVIQAGREFNTLASNILWEEEPVNDPSPGRDGESGGRGGAPSLKKSRQYGYALTDETILIRRGDILYAVRK